MPKKYKNQSSNHLIKNTFLRDLDPSTLEKKLREESYLGILTNDDTLFNPLNNIPMVAHDHFNEYLAYLMTRPEYFSFIVKTMFNMESFPLQILLLKELYEHRFPILIGARGLSKCIANDTFVITDSGIKQIKDFKLKDIPQVKQSIGDISLYGENTYNKVEYGFYNGERNVKVIKTVSGRSIKATLDHPIRVVSTGQIVWKNAEDIKVGDYLPIQRQYEQWPIYNDIDKDIAYMIGAMVGDGCYSEKSKNLSFTNIDKVCINNVNKGLKKWSKSKLTLVQSTTRKKIQYITKGNEANKYYKDKFIEEFACNQYSFIGFKETPKVIMGASFAAISSYLQGLFDTDGCCHTNSPVVELSTKSKILAEETQNLLLVLGIVSVLKSQYNKKYDKYYYKICISGSSLRVFKDKVGFKLPRKNRVLFNHCKKITNDNLDIIPKELVIEKLSLLRELARDTVYKVGDDVTDSKLLSVSRFKTCDLSYDRMAKVISLLGRSPAVSETSEYKQLKDDVEKHYYYDKVVSISDDYIKTYDVHLHGDDHSFVSNGFISHNTYTLGMYLLIKMITTPGVKCVITGAGFRQAKLVFDVMETIWNRAPMLRNCFRGDKNGPKHGTDAWHFRLGDSICHALPVGHDGSKVRGYRANCLIADEFASLQKTIFEEVMSGFLSVSSDNILQMKQNAFDFSSSALGVGSYWESKDSGIIQNQLILSGTAYYKHNHFYEYYKKWTDIIASEGNPEVLKSILPDEESRKDLNYEDYTVIRIPVEKIQSGHMDMAQVSRIKASVNKDTYLREFSACFSDDSDGFFKRSLINSCTISEDNKITKGGEEIRFNPAIYGRKDKKHIFGIDPAYQGDNFAIVILEINDTHRRIVHCWTTQASDHKQRLKDGIITENNYYQYCVRKVRDLMKRFPCAYIAMDKGGGGDAVKEAFADTLRLLPGEEAILPIIEPTEDPKDTDFLPGEHILHIIKFTSDWITQANHALKKDMETRDIIFPFHDSVSYVEAEFYNPVFVQAENATSFLYDTLEDCMSEIEDLKNELSIITISETATGKEHFDTPEKKTAGMQKGRMRKDRYSALLMANWVARNSNNLIVRPLNTMENAMEAYFGSSKNKVGFLGNGPIAQKLNELYSDDL